ncbi:hypothetical protein H4R33_006695 [Dimargaris cristalligena]|uniref:Methyltransferase domain-containing protein n=1 Tax=Dimargaris cristalligena TaxID=215637 RepID=A0A4Q0A3M3_9FUNG|nr:hypothetical protein H4R33_006695 [Dimargaris cristalligena]RKP40012.1 hypothetical protein BJ085DRAFT_31023 [Dimargaris cristalligena]|eukprot:RKP40012.1 hypothetical protein BJ085DRAFT_31023 [Dimargaris cristalligena]
MSDLVMVTQTTQSSVPVSVPTIIVPRPALTVRTMTPRPLRVTNLSDYLTDIQPDQLPTRRILDCRPQADFVACHLHPSVNFPEPRFDDRRYYQLPAKHIPLDILVPHEPSGEPYLTDAHMLWEKGWTVEHVVPVQGSYLAPPASPAPLPDAGWGLADRLGVTVRKGLYGGSGHPAPTHHVLFDPCPPLTTHITTIEQALPAPPNGFRTVLDLGCGSGRDLAWLCSRHQREAPLHGAGTTPLPWYGMGIDSVRGALRRARVLIQQQNVSSQVGLCHGKFHYDGQFYLKSPQDDPLFENPDLPLTQVRATDPLLPSGEAPVSITAQFNLVVGIRFLNRALFNSGQMDRWIAPGGFLLYSTFVQGEAYPNEHPQDPKHRLLPGELARLFGPDQGYEILHDAEECIEDGRHVNSFLARKLPQP